jgi:hypothetical protein
MYDFQENRPEISEGYKLGFTPGRLEGRIGGCFFLSWHYRFGFLVFFANIFLKSATLGHYVTFARKIKDFSFDAF